MSNIEINSVDESLLINRPANIWDSIAGIAQIYLTGYGLVRPDRPMSSAIGDLGRSFPELLNSIKIIKDNISSIKHALDNIDETIRGVVREERAVESLDKATEMVKTIETRMANEDSIRANADYINHFCGLLEVEIGNILTLTQSKNGKVTGLYLTAPFMAVLSKAYTYCQRQLVLDSGGDVNNAGTAFNHHLTKQAMEFSDKLIEDYYKLEEPHSTLKEVPLTVDRTYLYRFDPINGFVKTDIRQWKYECNFDTQNFPQCYANSLTAHSDEKYKNLYSLIAADYARPNGFLVWGTRWSKYRYRRGNVNISGEGYAIAEILSPQNEQEELVLKYVKKLFKARKFYDIQTGRFFKDIDKFAELSRKIKTGTWEINNKFRTYYRADCPHHNWDGMKREECEEAEKDLNVHLDSYPGEEHPGAEVIETWE